MKIEIETCECTLWSIVIIAVATIAISVTSMGVRCCENVTKSAFENGYEQNTVQGSQYRSWVKNDKGD